MYKVLDLTSGETGLLIKDRCWRFEASDVSPNCVLFPSFFNAHTHIADSVVEAPKMSVYELVGPGGYKFSVLREAGEEKIIEGMRKSIKLIEKTSATSLEFREGGIDGYRLYLKADQEKRLIALSRPSNVEEAEALSKISPGFNFSSTRDVDSELLEYCRKLSRKRGLIFAIHAGEVDSRDVEDAITLEPDFLIHMNMAGQSLLKKALDEGIKIVTCFRSNAFFDVFSVETYRTLSEYENWHIGTDNAMIATPSMLDELKFASNFIEADKLFSAATRNPFYESYTVARMDRFPNLKNPAISVIKRLESCDIECIIREKIYFS
ncbi:amidohydrolase family protein [Geoglobus acetivorans]